MSAATAPSLHLQNIPSSSKNSLEEGKPFWTPTKIALAALGIIAASFIIYRNYNQSSSFDITRSKVCSLVPNTVDERIQIAAEKLKNAYRNNCSSENTAFFEGIDVLLKQQHNDNLQANAILHLMIEEMLPCTGKHPTLEEFASSCTTNEGLLTKERYQEIFTLRGKQDRWEKEYLHYLSRLSDICELSKKYISL